MSNNQAKAAWERIAALLERMPIIERFEPIWLAFLKVAGCSVPETLSANLLPDYCYQILEIFRRTYLKKFPEISQLLSSGTPQVAGANSVTDPNSTVKLNWRQMGIVIGIVERIARFIALELLPQLERDGFMSMKPEEEKKLSPLLFSKKWFQSKLRQLKAGHPGQPAAAIADNKIEAFCAMLANSGAKFEEMAYQSGPAAMAELYRGKTEGWQGFLNANGELAGESGRANIYGFLLLVWPEIKAMQECNPPKTRTAFHQWLQPYAKAGIVSIGDLDQLHDVCDDIGLSFKRRGPPKRSS